MDHQDRSELERLTQRQQALRDRLQFWETAFDGELKRLLAVRQDLDDLRRQYAALCDESRQVEVQLGVLRSRWEPTSTLGVPAPESPSIEARETPAAPPPLPWAKPSPPQPESPRPVAPIGTQPPIIGAAHPLAPSLSPSGGEGASKPGEEDAVRGTPTCAPPLVGSPPIVGTSRETVLPETSEPTKPKESFEMRLGTYWAVRLGIVAILTGMVFLANYAYQNYVGRLGPGGKLTLLYLVSFGFIGVGAWLYRKQDSLKNYSRVLLAGGLAAVYFTTYAAHHVPNLRVIGSAALDGALLLVWAAFIVWLADRVKSEVLALFATTLGYYSSVMTTVGSFTLYSNLVLTLASVFFLVRNRWALLSSVSLAATYFAYAFWRFYHQGDWRWASPEEGLWKGVYFLMCYWLVFTAAAFLSKHEQFSGKNRALFATMNNGAFFGLFLLTMFQVRTGGFWKLALIFGTVLLVLAWLSSRFLPAEKITGNAYLTQGLLLITLGVVAYFSGLNLALALAFESVGLLVFATLLNHRIMRAGAFLTAVMAAVWLPVYLRSFDRRGLITGSVVGGLMLFNAQWDRRRKEPVKAAWADGLFFFTALAVLTWTLATWRNVDHQWVAFAWAVECVVYLLASTPLGNKALRYAAFPIAVLGTGGTLLDLLEQTNRDLVLRTGLWPSILTGGLVVFNAWWVGRRPKTEPMRELSREVTVFAALGLLTWLLTTWVFVPPQSLALVLAGEAAVLTLAGLGLRLPETTVMAQGFLVLAQLNCLAHFLPAEAVRNFSTLARLPWWNPAGVLLVTLGLSHGWQRWKLPEKLADLRKLCQAAYALAAVFVLMFWLKPHFSAEGWLAMTCLLALAATAYGTVTRLWWLVGAGQLFLCASLFEFGRQIVFETGLAQPAWFYTLTPIAVLVGLPFLVSLWLSRQPEAQARVGTQLNNVGLLYRLTAALLAFGWVFEYAPLRDRFWVLTLVGAVLFGWAGWRKAEKALWTGAVFTAVGLLVFWSQFETSRIVYLPNLLAILAVLAQQYLARRFAGRFNVPEAAHSAVMLIGGCSLWLLASRWVLHQAGGFYLTVAWAILALAIFTTGFLFRERMNRWLGLGILGCALGRVVLYDLWKLETLHRILSFMALGAVLLVLGFLYSKYQEKIRKWL